MTKATQAELATPEHQTDMTEFISALKNSGLKFEVLDHEFAVKEPKILDILGFFPAGLHQIVVKTEQGDVSFIRGYVSSGRVEGYGINKYAGDNFKSPVRVSNEEFIQLLTHDKPYEL